MQRTTNTMNAIAILPSSTADPLKIQKAKACLRGAINKREAFEGIVRRVCAFYEIERDELLGRRKPVHIAWPRQVAMMLCRECGASLHETARFFDRDHGTVIHAIKHVRDLCSVLPELAREVDAFRKGAV